MKNNQHYYDRKVHKATQTAMLLPKFAVLLMGAHTAIWLYQSAVG